MKKRILAWLLVLCLAVTLLPARTVLAEGVTALNMGSNAVSIPANSTAAYSFTAGNAGTYLFYGSVSDKEWTMSVTDANGTPISCYENYTHQSYGYLVSGLTEGSVYTVTFANMYSWLAKEMTVTVSETLSNPDISFSSDMATTANVGDTWGLIVAPMEANAVRGSLSWKTEPEGIASINTNYPVTWSTPVDFVAEGVVTITATDTVSGKTATAQVTVGQSGSGEASYGRVTFNGYDGMFEVTYKADGTIKQTDCTEEEELVGGAVLGDVLPFTITKDPVREGYTFEGWVIADAAGTLIDKNVYTTEQVMRQTVYGDMSGTEYFAKWAELDMDYYIQRFGYTPRDIQTAELILGQPVSEVVCLNGKVKFTAANLAAGTYALNIALEANDFGCSYNVVKDDGEISYFEGSIENGVFNETRELALDTGSYTITIDESGNSGFNVTATLSLVSLRDDGSGGDGSGDSTAPSFSVQGMGGTFTVTRNGENVCTDQSAWEDTGIAAGSSLAAEGYSVTDPVFWNSSRAFLGWIPQIYVPGVGNQDIEGATLLNTAQMLAYPARGDYQVQFIAQWAGEDSDYYTNVGFDGHGGEFDISFSNAGDSWTEYTTRCSENGQTIAAETGIVSVSDPTYTGYTFGGWLLFQPGTDNVFRLVNETIYTTEQALALTVPASDTIFYAYWKELGMDHYRYMNTGTLGGDSSVCNVTVNGDDRGMEASLTVTKGGEVCGSSGTGLFVPGGSSLRAAGYDVVDVQFWDTTRQLSGWNICTYEPYYEEGQIMYHDWVQIPGTSTMTTSQMLDYTIPMDKEVSFRAQWAGDETDYYSEVSFDGFNGTFEVLYGGQSYYTTPTNWWNCREGAVIGPEAGRYFDGDLTIAGLNWDGTAGDSWIQYTKNTDGNWQMVSGTPVTTAQVLQMTVTEADMLFVAYWSNRSWDEYVSYGQSGEGGGDEGGGDDGFRVPDGVTPTRLQLNVKASLPGEWAYAYYHFTATETGYYNLCSDAQQSSVDIWDNQNNYSWIPAMTGKTSIYLEAGQEYLFRTSTYAAAQIWVEKALSITNLQILSQDNTKSFQRSNDIEAGILLDGLTIKATFADGSVQTVTLPNDYSYDIGGFAPTVQYDLASAVGSTAPVTVSYGSAQTSFNVKLDTATVTKVEVVADKMPIEVIENTMGIMDSDYSGQYYYYSAEQILYTKASFRFTWSDGTTETLKLDGQDDYHGLRIDFNETYNQGDRHWTAGNTYDFKLYYGSLEIPVSVKIVESPVSSITVLTEPINTLGEPYFTSNGNGVWDMRNFDPTGLRFRINNRDGSTETYAFADLQLRDYNYYAGTHLVEFDTVDGMLPSLTGPGQIPFYIIIDGVKQTFNIKVVEKIVENNKTTVAPSIVEDALGAAAQTGGAVVVDGTSHEADLTDGSSNVPAVNLPAASVEKVAEANVDMTVKLDKAEVTVSKEAMTTIAQQSGQTQNEDITLKVEPVAVETLTAAQQELIRKVERETAVAAPVVLDISLQVGETPVSNFDGKITVRVPFQVPAGTQGEDFDVYYISGDGRTIQKMPTEFITENDGSTWLIFVTDHLSNYVALNSEPEGSVDYTPGSSAGGTGNNSGTGVPAPDTGDSADILGMTTMLLLSVMAMAVCLYTGKKRRA